MSTLIIRADATSAIGTGHVMRCLALAQAWRDNGGKVVFVSHCESEALRERITAEGVSFVSLEKPHPHPLDIDLTLATLRKLKTQNSKLKAWIIIDGYHFDADYQKCIKEAGYKLLWIDDYGHAAHYHADLILNQNISADPSLYISREPYTQLLLGTRYALLRREFNRWQGWQREHPSVARKVLVTLGGGDLDNITLKVIRALKQLDVSGLEAKIIIGPANPHQEALQNEIPHESNLQLLTDAANMPELMAWADVAISAGGSTCWELAFMGLPSLILVAAENQGGNARILDQETIGINLGWHEDVAVETIASQLEHLMMNSEIRSLMSLRGQALIDGHGGQRICKTMEGLTLRLRPALSEDCERVWKWANDPPVRAVSFSEALIPWEEHICWFQDRINRPYFFIALNQADLPVGQVRFDQKDAETVISVMIDSNFRNRHYGVALIMIACEKMFSNSDLAAIHAYLKPDNEVSRMAFVRAGFKELPETVCQGYPARHLILAKH